MGKALSRWQKVLPGAQVHTFPETGHFVPDEVGKEVAHRWRLFSRSLAKYVPVVSRCQGQAMPRDLPAQSASPGVRPDQQKKRDER